MLNKNLLHQVHAYICIYITINLASWLLKKEINSKKLHIAKIFMFFCTPQDIVGMLDCLLQLQKL